jgi:ABC-type multidrug transport system ATPase subunit
MFDVTRSTKLAIIITTHYIEEATKADRCGLMRNGVLLAEDAPKIIIHRNQCASLEEAFLRLCISQGSNDEIATNKCDPNEIEFIELDKNHKKNHETSIDENQRKRENFNGKTLKALVYKSYVQVARRPMYVD